MALATPTFSALGPDLSMLTKRKRPAIRGCGSILRRKSDRLPPQPRQDVKASPRGLINEYCISAPSPAQGLGSGPRIKISQNRLKADSSSQTAERTDAGNLPVVIADRGYDRNAARAAITERSSHANIPPKVAQHLNPPFSPVLYGGRKAIERTFRHLEHFHASPPATTNSPSTSSPPSSRQQPSAIGYQFPTLTPPHSARCMPDECTLCVAATRSAAMMSNDRGLRRGPISCSQWIN